jgi:hypothetical protein
MRPVILTALIAGAASLVHAAFAFQFDPQLQKWDLSNGVIRAVFALDDKSRFTLKELDDLTNGNMWGVPDGVASSPISVRMGGASYAAKTAFSLVDQYIERPNASTVRQVIVLEDLDNTAQIQVQLELYEGQPVLHHRVIVTNHTVKAEYVTFADMAPYTFAANVQAISLFKVAQWAVAPQLEDFQSGASLLDPSGTPAKMVTGSGGQYCAWLAVADENRRGLFSGWEFDGETSASAAWKSSGGVLSLRASLASVYHRVGPGESFNVPSGFIGVFQGGWDEAGYRTQRFAEAVLARPAPPHFPYVSWDSWAYNAAIDEQTLRLNAQIAATIGIELFIVDLGWARELGDWQEDPQKFPSGLRALSDYVHSLGMKFGLHFAFAEAMADSPVLQMHPDWTASVSNNYFGALSLCLSHQPVRDWVIQQALAIIDNYNVDYLLQDGQNMVKLCTKTSHTHNPRDSNYSNAVEGLDAVIEHVEKLRPNVLWENCENGGNMMTFNMVRHYVTSTTNDASGALGSRQAVWGATYPFPPRFADRYMPETPSDVYITRSYMFGGPWHLMNQLAAMDSPTAAFAQSEIQIYKQLRDLINGGQVFHLMVAPGSGHTDALESYSPVQDSAVAIVTRDGDPADFVDLRLAGLQPYRNYQVHFQNDPRVLSMTGQDLMTIGVRVLLPSNQNSEIVYVGR